MTDEADPFTWWRAALADPSKIGKELPISEGYPEQGFYRSAALKGGALEAVSIWKDGDEWYALQGDKEVDPQRIWLWAAQRPVSYEDYKNARAGHPWPDEDETVAAAIREVGKDHNEGGLVPPEEILKSQVDSSVKGADKYKVIKSDEDAVKATGLRNRLNELGLEGEKKHKAEKDPIALLAKKVDEKWLPTAKLARSTAVTLRSSLEAWETQKARDAAAAQKLIEDAAAAERKRIEDEQKALAPEERAPIQEIAPPAPQVAPTQVRPSYGRASSTTLVTVVEKVTDWPKLATYYSSRIAIQELLTKLANEDIKGGTTPPGVTTHKVAKVK